MNRPFYVLVPNSVKFDKIIENNINPSIAIGMLYFMFKGLVKGVNKKENENYKSITPENIATPIGAKTFLTIFQNGYKKVERIFHREVWYKFKYKVGKYPFSYSYSPKHHFNKFQIHKIEPNTKFEIGVIKRLNNFIKSKKNKEKLQKEKEVTEKFRIFVKFFEPEKLEIDFEKALANIDEKYTSKHEYQKYVNNCNEILNFQNGNYWFSNNSETDNRFHHSFLNLKKEYRKYVTYDKSKLVQIDVSNSVPFILASILNNNFIIDINNKELATSNIVEPLYKIIENAKTISQKELQQFFDRCSDGTIYLSFKSEYINRNSSWLIADYYDNEAETLDLTDRDYRKLIKGDFLKMIFADTDNFRTMQEIFRKEYPAIHQLLMDFKTKYSYEILSYVLFQVESYVMLEEIAKGFNKAMRGREAFFTFHDCIVVQEKNLDKLHAFMITKMSEIFKIPPKMEIDYW